MSAGAPKRTGGVVIRVEDGGNRSGTVGRFDGAFVVAGVEALKIETTLGLGFPETEVVGVAGAISRDHDIVRYRKNFLTT